MALKDLKTAVATPTSTSTFNTAISAYPDLAAKLQAIATSGGYPQKFSYNGVEFSTETQFFDGTSLYVDDDNKIMILKFYYNNLTVRLFCCYGDDKDYIIYFGSSLASAQIVVGNTAYTGISMSAVSSPTLSADTFIGHYPYIANKIFKDLVRYMTTPSTLQDVEIKTDTKHMLIVCGGSNTAYSGCMCVVVDL